VKDHYLALKGGNAEVIPEVSARSELFTKQITWDGQCSHPRWSPSGREIAFYKKEGGVTGIYTVGSGGGPVSRVIESSESLEILPEFEWDPQGGDIAFTANVIDENWERLLTLNVVDKSGIHVTRILNQRNVPFGINSIRWSPNSYMLGFNLDYGKVDPELERIQRVLIANLNKLEETYPERNRTIHGKHIATTSVLEQTNWVVGWASSTKLIFLASNADTRMQPDQEGYEIWQFDALTERRKLLRKGEQVKPFRSVALLGGQDRLIYSGRSGKYVTSLDYFTGMEVRLLNSPKVSSLSPVYVNELNQVLFVVDDQLWANNLKGETLRVTQLDEHVADFTLSPLSERVCFVRNGSLFVSRVESSTATTAH
jgi:hypothetical protein